MYITKDIVKELKHTPITKELLSESSPKKVLGVTIRLWESFPEGIVVYYVSSCIGEITIFETIEEAVRFYNTI